MRQSPSSKDKESEPNAKVTILRTSLPPVAQIRLARIQQWNADIAQNSEEINRLRKLVARDNHDLRKEWGLVRREIMKGAEVEEGPLQAFVRTSGHGKKRRTVLVVK